jgi:hypothetical protein
MHSSGLDLVDLDALDSILYLDLEKNIVYIFDFFVNQLCSF